MTFQNFIAQIPIGTTGRFGLIVLLEWVYSMTANIYYRLFPSKKPIFKLKHPKQGKTAIVTGGTAGIGKELSKQLSLHGFKVYILARNPQKAHRAISDLASQGCSVEYIECDFSDLKSVQKAARLFGNRDLHLLVNNAGVHQNKFVPSADGYELQFAVVSQYYCRIILDISCWLKNCLRLFADLRHVLLMYLQLVIMHHKQSNSMISNHPKSMKRMEVTPKANYATFSFQ